MDPFLELWDFGDLPASRARFEAFRDQTDNLDLRLQCETQIARTLGLERQFDEALERLQTVADQLPGTASVAQVRYELELGCVFRTQGNPEGGIPHFQQAARLAEALQIDGLHVDALHMLALADNAKSAEWNQQAIDLATRSEQPEARRWIGSLENNIGWDAFDGGRFDDALSAFRRSESGFLESGQAPRAEVARWCQARTLRALGQTQEALSIQLSLATARPEDVYVAEELAYLYSLAGEANLASQWAKRALDIDADGALPEDRREALAALISV